MKPMTAAMNRQKQMARSNKLVEKKSIAVCPNGTTLCAAEDLRETVHGVFSHKQQLQGRRLFAQGVHPVRGFWLRLRRWQQVAAPEMVGRACGHEELRRHLL